MYWNEMKYVLEWNEVMCWTGMESCIGMKWNLVIMDGVVCCNEMESCNGWSRLLECNQDLLKSPLHTHAISLWQVAPGLLKSHAAQVASSTIACGW